MTTYYLPVNPSPFHQYYGALHCSCKVLTTLIVVAFIHYHYITFYVGLISLLPTYENGA